MRSRPAHLQRRWRTEPIMIRPLLLAALLLGATAAHACGHCIEDKIAACYDHAVVTQALARKHQVAFFALDGPLSGGAIEKKAIELLAASAPGVDAGSVRVSTETAALSVAFDPARVSFIAVQQAVEAKLKRRGLALLPLKVMDRPGDLKAAGPPAAAR